MTGKRKIKSDDKPATKKEMINCIGRVFEELKVDNRHLEMKLDEKTHRLEVMMEADKQEIISVLETFFAVSAKSEVVQEHEERIAGLSVMLRS